MEYTKVIDLIRGGELDGTLCALYGKQQIPTQRERYINAIKKFTSLYGERDISLFSVPGRSELSGNHTDHNRGCVIATSVDLDIIAVASRTGDGVVRLNSEGFGEDVVDIDGCACPDETFFGTSKSLIAGMCKGLSDSGYVVGGFVAYATSNVLKGSGLSSSAAFEDMIGNILNHLYNDGKMNNVEIAKISQIAENVFFGKPCGLMDQVACAVGGIVAIDFKDKSAPVITPINFDLTAAGYRLCIVNTGGNHADLTDDYASIPSEMKSVARAFGCEVLREVDESQLIRAIPSLREFVGDRAIMRALHFYEENKRVQIQKQALESGDLNAFLKNVNDSGHSSFCYLQNVYTSKNTGEQGLSLALCLCETVLDRETSAWRVHGGGFAGTIQAYVRECDIDKFKTAMDNCFGNGACIVLSVRQTGACKVC